MANEPEREAEALAAHLDGRLPADHPDLPKEEAELGQALRSVAAEIQPAAQFEAELEHALMQEARRQPPNLRRSLAGAGRTAAWAGLAVLLLLGLGWVIRTLTPGTMPGAGPTEAASLTAVLSGSTETQQATQSPETAEPNKAAASQAAPTTYNLPMLPEAEVVLQAELPEAPSEVRVYQQKAWPALSAENALQLAKQLGVEGQLYKSPIGSPGATSYLVSDGYAQVTVPQTGPWFLYRAARSREASSGSNLSPEQVTLAGEAFLKTHGLNNYTYRAETQADTPGAAQFVQTLDKIPVNYTSFDVAKVLVLVDDQGRVTQAESNLGDFEALGNYAIISAQDAWEKILSPDTQNGVETHQGSGQSSATKMRQRTYPLGSRIELFGHAQSYSAYDPNIPPLILFKDYSVSGNTQGLSEAAANNRFIQAWGQFQEDAQGRLSFQMEGWQASFFPEQSLEGTLKRQDGRAYLVTNSQQLLLPDIPDDLAEGTTITAKGVVLEEAETTLDWSALYSSVMGGGGDGNAAEEQRKAVIDKIELVYTTEKPHYAEPTSDGTPIYAQPVWRFSGQYEDGTIFVILVQALRSEPK